MNFDDILVEIGEFGRYQKVKFFLLCLPSIILGLHSMGAVFLTALPKFRCQIPGYADDTYAVHGTNHSLLLDLAIPSFNNSETCEMEYKTCEVYEQAEQPSGALMVGDMTSFVRGNVTTECSNWVYDQSVFDRTIMTEFNLVCGKETIKAIAQTVFMVGLLWGSLLFGAISDRFGRKKTLMVSILIQLIFAIATAFSPGMIVFMILRMLIGATSTGIYVTCFVLGIELTGPSKRMWTGLWTNVTWAVGVLAMSGIAYGLREWNHLQLTISIPMVLFLSYWWLIPESPRWLIAKGRHEEALTIIADMARWNKKPFSAVNLEKETTTVAPVKPWKMFTSWVLLIRCLAIYWNWIVVTMVYYGLSLNAGNLAGDIYLNSFLNGLVEIVGYAACMALWDRLGRRIMQVGSMLLGGTACICTIIPVYVGTSLQCEAFSLATVNLVLSLIGKFGASIAFATIYIWSSEIFPTVVRNSSMGISSMLARVGGMVAPFIADLTIYVGGKLGQALPLLIFGVCSVSAGIVALILPETLNQKLPDTVDEAKQFGRKSSRKMWFPRKTSTDNDSSTQPASFAYANPSYSESSLEKKY